MGISTNNNTPTTTTKTTTLNRRHFETFFSPKPHYPPPNNQNGRLRQLQLHLLELLLRSGLLHLQQISSSSHRPTCRYHHPPAPQWHSITSAFIIIVFLKKGKHVNGFLRRVSRGIVDFRSGIGGGRLTKIRDKK